MMRQPSVAGQFYPKMRSSLEKILQQLVQPQRIQREVIGAIMPHAGYIYSGYVAGAVVSGIKVKDTFIIMGPNHTGMGKPFSIMTEGAWQTPLGSVSINEGLAKEILTHSKSLKEDEEAHMLEHSIEVEIPFLQYLKKDISIIPIVISQHNPQAYRQIGTDIADVIKTTKEEVVVIASTDFTHYEPHEIARKKDRHAIDAILELDDAKLLEIIEKENISMCGYAPVVILINIAKLLGAKRAELIKYQTSGDTSGDYSSVVGYAGFIIPKE